MSAKFRKGRAVNQQAFFLVNSIRNQCDRIEPLLGSRFVFHGCAENGSLLTKQANIFEVSSVYKRASVDSIEFPYHRRQREFISL